METTEGLVYLRIYELENALDDLLCRVEPVQRCKAREDVAAAIFSLRAILHAVSLRDAA